MSDIVEACQSHLFLIEKEMGNRRIFVLQV
jgi:hypothetical protein